MVWRLGHTSVILRLSLSSILGFYKRRQVPEVGEGVAILYTRLNTRLRIFIFSIAELS